MAHTHRRLRLSHLHAANRGRSPLALPMVLTPAHCDKGVSPLAQGVTHDTFTGRSYHCHRVQHHAQHIARNTSPTSLATHITRLHRLQSSVSSSFFCIGIIRLLPHRSTYSAQLCTRNHVSTFNAISLTLSGMFDRGGGVGRLLWPSVTTGHRSLLWPSGITGHHTSLPSDLHYICTLSVSSPIVTTASSSSAYSYITRSNS